MYIYRYICIYNGILSGRLNWKIELDTKKLHFQKQTFYVDQTGQQEETEKRNF